MRLAALAGEAVTRRFVQLSGIGSDPDADDSYIRARGQGEAAVRAALPGATIIRPAVMFGDGDALLDALLSVIRATARRLPVYPLFGTSRTRLQPAWVEDVVQAIARLLDADTSAFCYELAGADSLTYRELVETVAQASGLRSRPVPVPFAIWKPLAAIAEWLPGAPLTRVQVALMQTDNVAPGTLTNPFHPIGVASALSPRMHRHLRLC